MEGHGETELYKQPLEKQAKHIHSGGGQLGEAEISIRQRKGNDNHEGKYLRLLKKD